MQSCSSLLLSGAGCLQGDWQILQIFGFHFEQLAYVVVQTHMASILPARDKTSSRWAASQTMSADNSAGRPQRVSPTIILDTQRFQGSNKTFDMSQIAQQDYVFE